MSEMWKREEFLIANGMSQLPNSSMINDLSPYEYFDGGLDTAIDMDFSELRGTRNRRVRKPKGRIRKAVSNTQSRISSRRSKKTADKQKQAEIQKKAIEEINKNSESDAKVLQQLTQASTIASATPTTTNKTGLSKSTKTALIIGGVAVFSFIGYLVYKKFKK